MFFFKSLLFVAFAVYCITLTNAQLFKYRNLTNDDFAKLCAINNVNLTESQEKREVAKILFANLKAMENPEKTKHCMGTPLQDALRDNMNKIVKKCIQGSIKLNENDIQQLIDESEEKMCGLYRLACYDVYLEKSCLDYTNNGNCEDEMFKMYQENNNQFANLGLSYTEKGLKNMIQLLDCTSVNVKKNCKKEQNEKREQIQKEYTDTFKVIRKL